MKKFLLKPQSQVVGDSTNLEVRWRAEHAIPKGGFAILTFPKWNPNQANPSFQKSYIQGAAACSPLAVLTSSIRCNYANDQLIVSGIAPT